MQIIGLLLTGLVISLIEVPKMIALKLWRELITFFILLGGGVGLALYFIW
ncbi:hypothetical protein [Natroniella sp. ANB-PHB2]